MRCSPVHQYHELKTNLSALLTIMYQGNISRNMPSLAQSFSKLMLNKHARVVGSCGGVCLAINGQLHLCVGDN